MVLPNEEDCCVIYAELSTNGESWDNGGIWEKKRVAEEMVSITLIMKMGVYICITVNDTQSCIEITAT
jgi:hypothetical protein